MTLAQTAVSDVCGVRTVRDHRWSDSGSGGFNRGFLAANSAPSTFSKFSNESYFTRVLSSATTAERSSQLSPESSLSPGAAAFVPLAQSQLAAA